MSEIERVGVLFGLIILVGLVFANYYVGYNKGRADAWNYLGAWYGPMTGRIDDGTSKHLPGTKFTPDPPTNLTGGK